MYNQTSLNVFLQFKTPVIIQTTFEDNHLYIFKFKNITYIDLNDVRIYFTEITLFNNFMKFSNGEQFSATVRYSEIKKMDWSYK